MAPQTSTPSTSALLSLPPEMRNRIYRFALLHENDILTQTGSKPPADPAILRTCRQLRNEASGIYYQENDIVFEVESYDIDTYVRWTERSIHRRKANVKFRMSAPPNWANLLRWLKAFYDNAWMLRLPPQGGRVCPEPAGFLFDIAEEMQVGMGCTWGEVKRVLEFARGALAAVDEDWEE